MFMMMRVCVWFSALVWASQPAMAQSDPALIFAVVTKEPADKRKVSARVLFGGQITDGVLLAPDDMVNNPVWRNLEICHSIRGEAFKTGEGYRLESVRVIDSGQLPMELQSVAGDCLIRKALEVAPMAD
jgi:hypothetical protein